MTLQPWFIEFAEALDAGNGSYRRCERCDESWLPPRTICPSCQNTDLTEAPFPDVGEVESHTTITATIPAFADETPYTVAFARFDDGLAIAGQWRGDEEVTIGDRVTPAAEQIADGWIIVLQPVGV